MEKEKKKKKKGGGGETSKEKWKSLYSKLTDDFLDW